MADCMMSGVGGMRMRGEGEGFWRSRKRWDGLDEFEPVSRGRGGGWCKGRRRNTDGSGELGFRCLWQLSVKPPSVFVGWLFTASGRISVYNCAGYGVSMHAVGGDWSDSPVCLGYRNTVPHSTVSRAHSLQVYCLCILIRYGPLVARTHASRLKASFASSADIVVVCSTSVFGWQSWEPLWLVSCSHPERRSPQSCASDIASLESLCATINSMHTYTIGTSRCTSRPLNVHHMHTTPSATVGQHRSPLRLTSDIQSFLTFGHPSPCLTRPRVCSTF